MICNSVNWLKRFRLKINFLIQAFCLPVIQVVYETIQDALSGKKSAKVLIQDEGKLWRVIPNSVLYLFQNHPQRHEKPVSYYFDTAIDKRKMRWLERDLTRIFGYLDRRSTHWAIESTGLVASLIQFKCTKYFRDDLTLVLEDAHAVFQFYFRNRIETLRVL